MKADRWKAPCKKPAAPFVGTAGLKLWVDCGPFGSVVAANVFVGA